MRANAQARPTPEGPLASGRCVFPPYGRLLFHTDQAEHPRRAPLRPPYQSAFHCLPKTMFADTDAPRLPATPLILTPQDNTHGNRLPSIDAQRTCKNRRYASDCLPLETRLPKRGPKRPHARLNVIPRAALSGHLSCSQCGTFCKLANTNAAKGVHVAPPLSETSEGGRRSIYSIRSNEVRDTPGRRSDREGSSQRRQSLHSSRPSKLRPTAQSFVPSQYPLEEQDLLLAGLATHNWDSQATLPPFTPQDQYPGIPTLSYPIDSYIRAADLLSLAYPYPLYASADTGFSNKIFDPSWTSESWPNVPWQMRYSLSGLTYYPTGHRANQPFLTQGQH